MFAAMFAAMFATAFSPANAQRVDRVERVERLERADSIVAYPGFDATAYPGDSAMRAWAYPSSPYRWVGYYLASPCHRDSSWTGRRAALDATGWGFAAIYVGQQDWSRMAIGRATPHARSDSAGAPVVCSSALLTTDRARSDAADAVAQLRAEGFADGSTVFLDVETVSDVTPALLAYVRTWTANVLSDGRYRPGIYAAKTNAQPLYAAASSVYHVARRRDRPPFWIASAANFSLARRPSAVGIDYAEIWQGIVAVSQQFNGVRLTVDVNVAARSSPSAP